MIWKGYEIEVGMLFDDDGDGIVIALPDDLKTLEGNSAMHYTSYYYSIKDLISQYISVSKQLPQIGMKFFNEDLDPCVVKNITIKKGVIEIDLVDGFCDGLIIGR